jgi:diguanylate cyclase (GGDEF)-like protein/PAS domain S-box-containing protein
MTISAKIPEKFESIFAAAEKTVAEYFELKSFRPDTGSIEISEDRYILLRGASISVEFFQLCRKLFGEENEKEADMFASSLLYELAHSIGISDAKRFHEKMGLEDPVSKLSAGPIHFSYSGWAFVEIDDESSPSPDEGYFLVYSHPYSVESDAWEKAELKPHSPVCVMNAGYSSGWCQESFGLPLEARELTCCALGHDKCQFVMATPENIESRIALYLKGHPEFVSVDYPIHGPDFGLLNKSEVGQKPGFTDLLSEHLFTYARNLESTKKILDHKMQLLEESEEKFRSIFEQAAMGIALVGPDGSWLEVNDKICEIVDYSKDELLCLTFQDITFTDDLQADLDFMQQLLDGAIDHYSMEKRYIKKSGELTWIELTVSLTRNLDGSPKYFVSVVEDISLRKQYEEELSYSLTHDSLTGLNSRGSLDATIIKEVERAGRYGRPLSMLMVDIDHFKKVNDEHGHQNGDLVLREVGKILINSIRGCDTPGRFGGEEFVVVLPELDVTAASRMAERIRSNIEVHPFSIKDGQIPITVSIGVGVLSEDTKTSDGLVKGADDAMYKAKQAGRNCVKCYATEVAIP